MPNCQTSSPFFRLSSRALVVWCGALCLPPAHAAEVTPVLGEPLQTLFYSASERSNMTRIRSGLGADGAAEVPQIVHVNGIVKRQGGGSTAWVNGLPVREGDVIATDQRVVTIDGGVSLNGVPVKVGEALDLTTQARHDVVAPGAVTVRDKK